LGMYDRDWYRDLVKKQREAEERRYKTYKYLCITVIVVIILCVTIFNQNQNLNPLGHPMSTRQADFLSRINESHAALSEKVQAVSDHHRVPAQQRDIGSYQQSLIDGITICESIQKDKKF